MLFRYIFITLLIFPLLSIAQESADSESTASPSDILSSLEKVEESEHEYYGKLFTASAQFGLLYLTGDTRSADIKSGLDLRFEKGPWRSFFIVDLLIKKTEEEITTDTDEVLTVFDTTEQKWNITSQTNYTLDSINQNYVYGSAYYEQSRFSSFDSQASLSTGWGRRWYDTSQFTLDADIGPGFKRDIPQSNPDKREDGISHKTQDTLILQAQALYIRQMNEHIEFKQLVIMKYAIESGQNSTYKAESSITSRLIDSLQLKLNFIVDYNTKVDEDKEKVNTETSIVLVYSF